MMNGHAKKDNNYALHWAKKIKCVRLLGGRCEKCGDSNIIHLEFHHEDGSKKEDSVSRLIDTKKWDSVELELKKCKLLCSNCHMDYHCGSGRKTTIKTRFLDNINKTKCNVCGYSKNVGVLSFHHVNPIDKKYGIAKIMERKKNETSLKELSDEIDKCELLCRNCHRDKHFDINRFKRLEAYIYHKVETHKQHKVVDENKVIEMVRLGKRHCEIAKEIDCCQTTVRGIINRMKRKHRL